VPAPASSPSRVTVWPLHFFEVSLLSLSDSGASSVSWRLSPSSSGYKSQSQMSESITPSPTSTPNQIVDSHRHDSNCSELAPQDKDSSIVWAVTDIQRVPKGSIIINPQTGEALKNDDGSVYHYDPNNPPLGLVNNASKPPPSPKKGSPQNASPKKRSAKLSPNHKSHVTNSSTSPSLPYSPPLSVVQQQNRGFQFMPGIGDNMPMAQQQYPVYNPGYPAPSGHEGLPYYQQPCIVYTAPYSMPISPQFEGRMVGITLC
jgi:encore-like protein